MEEKTIEKMNKMHMKGMSQTYHQDISVGIIKDYTTDEYLARIIDIEWESRQNRKIKHLKRSAKFREHAHPLNIDYTVDRQLDKGVMKRLLSLNFIKQSENIIFTGLTGTGKSYLGQAIGVKACEMLNKVSYYPMSTLGEQVEQMKIQGNYPKWVKKLQGVPLLILDDFGLTNITMNTRKALMDIIDYKYGKSSLIIISQIPVKNWHQLIGEDTIADAIMDRIVHNSHRIELKGESLRKQKRVG
jgi:DNA replication protein DnaC